MTAKEWLQKGRRMNFEIDELLASRDRVFEKACKCGFVDYEKDKIQTTKTNSTENKIITYIAYTQDIDMRTDALYEYRRQMLSCINKLNDSTYRTILIAYYINCKGWEQIARDQSYSVRQILRLHGEALIKFEEFYKDVTKCH